MILEWVTEQSAAKAIETYQVVTRFFSRVTEQSAAKAIETIGSQPCALVWLVTEQSAAKAIETITEEKGLPA